MAKCIRSACNVLLIEPFQMGDVLSLSVMLNPILERFPQARIFIWCHPRAAMVFANDRSHHGQVVTAPFPWSGRGSKCVARSRRMEKRVIGNAHAPCANCYIDVAIDPRGDIRSQAMMLLCRLLRAHRLHHICGLEYASTWTLANARRWVRPPRNTGCKPTLRTLGPLARRKTPALASPRDARRSHIAHPHACCGEAHRGHPSWGGVALPPLERPIAMGRTHHATAGLCPISRIVQIAGPGEQDLAVEAEWFAARRLIEILSTSV